MALYTNPSTPTRSLEENFAKRIQVLEKQMGSLQRDGAKRAQDGARIFTWEIEGDGSETVFNAPHGFQTRKVLVQVWELETPYQLISSGLTIKAITEDQIELTFSAAPADGKKFNVQIIG